MDTSEIVRRLKAAFLEELHEHVETLNRDLLALEKDPLGARRQELLTTMFRAAHSIKGASRAVSIDLIEKACHRLEDILSAVRADKVELTRDLFGLLFSAADALEEAGMRLREEQSLNDGLLSGLLPHLERAAGGESASPLRTPREVAVEDEGEGQWVGAQPADAVATVWESLPQNSPTGTAASAAVAADSGASERLASPGVFPAGPVSTLRVAASKLDTLLAQSGELSVARRRVAARIEDVTAIRDQVAEWRSRWRSLAKPLRTLLQDDGTGRRVRFPRRSVAVVEKADQQIFELEKRLDLLGANMAADSRLLSQTCDALENEVHHVRMLPFAHACVGLERAVRDLACAAGKEVSLVLGGTDVEMDRSVLESLKDPLLHLVRNAVDHGIERPTERRAAGKPESGTITVHAALRGRGVEVTIADDGRGFNVTRIRETARQRRLAIPQNEKDLVRLVFAPGFSTAETVSDISGRGVGLDVVQSRIEALHGVVDASFQPGRGTCFTLQVPLTLTTIHAVMAEAGGQTYAMPTDSVQQIVRLGTDQVRSVGGRECLLLRGSPTPLAALADTLGSKSNSAIRPDTLLGVVLAVGNQRACFLVDAVLAEQEVVVKSLGARIRRARHVSGATLLPSGRVALVLNVGNLVRTALSQTPTQSLRSVAPEIVKRRLLVVEDAVTTRALLKSILESAGYDVSVAADGRQAWQMLSAGEFELVVSDVEMPNMNGFELTETIRRSEVFANLPVILVTARATDQDRTRGVQVGADAYLVKSGFDQRNLLESIEQLL